MKRVWPMREQKSNQAAIVEEEEEVSSPTMAAWFDSTMKKKKKFLLIFYKDEERVKREREKPMCASVHVCYAIVALCEKYGRVQQNWNAPQ